MEVYFTQDSFHPDERTFSSPPDKLTQSFLDNPGHAFYELGFSSETFQGTLRYLQFIAQQFTDQLRRLGELEEARENTRVKLDDLNADLLLSARPFAPGSEWITEEWLEKQYALLNQQFHEEAMGFDGSMKKYLASKNTSLHTAQRIYFHLVENPDNVSFPFAFLATYASAENGRVHHHPLHHALKVFEPTDPQLLKLLSCLTRACEASMFVDQLVTSGEMFHPLQLTSQEAYSFLKSAADIEEAGITCRIPNWWRRKYSSASLSLKLASQKEDLLGMDSLLKMQPELVFQNQKITAGELRELLKAEEGLYLFKGRWIEISHKRLQELKEAMDRYQDPLTLKQALQMQNGIGPELEENVQITFGKWLNNVLEKLKNPASGRHKAVPRTVQAQLRPYQKDGYSWLSQMNAFGLGACLADDMGLGKTLQVLTFLESYRNSHPDGHVLLVVPASLIGNWQQEARKFTPALPIRILHGMSAAKLDEQMEKGPGFLCITTYQMALRMKAIEDIEWDYIILDEAQAIKNPRARQTRKLKSLKARNRLALTGTPIENDLSNLWSLFDFLNTGLLGSYKDFSAYCQKLNSSPEGYARLRSLTSLFMLRRLKTDKSIIHDLPEKIEQTEHVALSKKQIALYRQQVKILEEKIRTADGIDRKGLVLSALTKLKQICNHPAQYTGSGDYTPAHSGKFEVLAELCTQIYERRECVLVFTQYREIIPELVRYLSEIFGRPGYSISGSTSVKERTCLAEAFNAQDTYIPFMVLSLKAAGTGLNLTAASHVIHFDRWWNPAVENQATDRAFRIGQQKNVQVHKLVCTGTIEEKIDELIESKKELAENVIGENQTKWITELSNDDVLRLMKLDV